MVLLIAEKGGKGKGGERQVEEEKDGRGKRGRTGKRKGVRGERQVKLQKEG